MAPLLFPNRVGGIYKRKEYYVFLFSLFGDFNAGKWQKNAKGRKSLWTHLLNANVFLPTISQTLERETPKNISPPNHFSFSTVAASSKGSKVIFFSFRKCIGGRRRENEKSEKASIFAFFLFLTSPLPSIRDPPPSSSSSFGVKIQSIAPSGVKGEKGKEGGGITNATKTNSLETDKKVRPYLLLLLYSSMHRKKGP